MKSATVPADILCGIKDDLGIPVDDASHDAWLARRIAAVWARIETFTGRTLAYPPASFTDHWAGVVDTNRHLVMPPILAAQPRASVYLRVFPVLGVTALELNRAPADAALVVFDPKSGKLVGVQGTAGYATDLGGSLLASGAKITYTGGFAELPSDLYEVIFGTIQPAYAARQSQASGMGGGISAVNVQDVGSVEFGNVNSFVDASTKRGSQGGVDPLLGPFAQMLDSYIDWRSMLGSSTYPATTRVGDVEPTPIPPTPTPGPFGDAIIVSARATPGTPILSIATEFALDPADTNVGDYWDDVTNTFTPPHGAYQINASIACVSTNNNADVSLSLLKNGVEYARATASATAGNVMAANLALALVAQDGDSFALQMFADRSDMTVLVPGSGFSVLGREPAP